MIVVPLMLSIGAFTIFMRPGRIFPWVARLLTHSRYRPPLNTRGFRVHEMGWVRDHHSCARPHDRVRGIEWGKQKSVGTSRREPKSHLHSITFNTFGGVYVKGAYIQILPITGYAYVNPPRDYFPKRAVVWKLRNESYLVIDSGRK